MRDIKDIDAVLQEQIAYYRARAPEYDHWWERTHQYQLPPQHQAAWQREVTELEAHVDGWLADASSSSASASREVLELACGTGVWTRRLAAWADRVVAVDAAPEVIAINESKLAGAGLRERVEFLESDVFEVDLPDRAFDVVWFSFWLSHIPPARFDAFWQIVARVLRPGGVAMFVDNRWNDGVWPATSRPGEGPPADPIQLRTDLRGGDAYRVVKLYYEPEPLTARLGVLGWRAEVIATDRFFITGRARLARGARA